MQIQITDNLQKQIPEVKYLVVENTWRYRVIIRFFYQQCEAMNYLLSKEEIFSELVKHDIFKEYTIEQCEQDLEALRGFGNLNAIQDTYKAKTLEEFKNKRYKYEVTQKTIEIERFINKLDSINLEGSALDASLLDRLKESLRSFANAFTGSDKNAFGIWDNLVTDFEKLNEKYKDYIKKINGIKPDSLLDAVFFLEFKEKLIEYLNEFVITLQNNMYTIEGIFESISEDQEITLLNKIARYYMQIPREISELEKLDENQVFIAYKDKWKNIKRWFVGSDNRVSDIEQLSSQTNEIIRKISMYAVQLADSLNRGISKKEEYRRISELFFNCQSIEEAHRLSAFVFGLTNMAHFQGDFIRKTESVNSGVFDEEPFVVSIKPKIRTYREKLERHQIVDKTDEKNRQREEILNKRKLEKETIDSFIKDGRIDFSQLDNIDSEIRKILLSWLSAAFGSGNYTMNNEFGNTVRISNPAEQNKIILNCKDGKLTMPAFVLEIN